MGNRVNPPKQRTLPKSLAENIDTRKAFDDTDLILFQLWMRTGAGEDWIEEVRQALYEFDDIFTENIKQELEDDIVITSTDYTSSGNQLIICTERLTVTLNDNPENQEKVKVRQLSNGVFLSGNGRNINGYPTARIRKKYTSWEIMYIIETDEWVIV